MSLNYKINKFILSLFYNNLKSNRVLIYIFFIGLTINYQFLKNLVSRVYPHS